MKFRSFRKLFVGLLAVLLTASFSLSAVRAGEMTMKMSASSTMSSFVHSDLSGCDRAGSNKIKADSCVVVCASSVIATLTEPGPFDVAEIMTIVPLPEDEVVSGAKPPPERYPPKTI